MSTFEDAIVAAIVAQFFEPRIEMDWRPANEWVNGQQVQRMELMPISHEPPAAKIAYTIYEAHREAIVSGVVAQLDMDDLIAKITESVVKSFVGTMTPSFDRYWKPNEEVRERLHQAVWDRIADEFGRRAVEYLKETGGLARVLEAGT